jgi:hypothetical protein
MSKLLDKYIPIEFRIISGWIFVFVLVLVAIPLISFGVWKSIPSANLGVVVLDKTVPNTDFQEHQSLHWLLNHLKYTKPNGQIYDASRDFFGFFPSADGSYKVRDFSKLKDVELEALVRENQLFYFADTYGVYENDLKEVPIEAPSKKIYGGMENADLHLLRLALEAEKDVVAEFNTIASPTSKAVRREFENLTDIKWTGWITRYFDELDTTLNKEIPAWLISGFLRQHGGDWAFEGSGMVFLHEEGQIEVLVFGDDFQNEVPKILTMPTYQKRFHIPEIVNYPYWIDLMLVSRDYEVVSYYDLKPTDQGLEKMRSWGIPRYFPAVVAKSNGKGKVYYFAGDFVDNPIKANSYHYFGIAKLWRMLLTAEDISQRNSFFWNFYHPLMASILADCHERNRQ